MGDGGGRGRHKTDVMRDWEWKDRKRGNMIENEASAGFEAWMNGLCFSGTATGLNLRNSPKHLTREAEFLFLGGLRLLRIISKIGTFWDSLTSLHDWQSRRLFFENRCEKKLTRHNLTFAVIIKRNHRVKTGFVCVYTHHLGCLRVYAEWLWVSLGDCGCDNAGMIDAEFTNGLAGLRLRFKIMFAFFVPFPFKSVSLVKDFSKDFHIFCMCNTKLQHKYKMRRSTSQYDAHREH